MTAISQLDPVTTLAPNDAIPVEQAIDGVTRYATPAQIQVAAGALIGANNLADVPNEQAARNNLGLGGVAVLGIGNGLAAGGGNLAVEFGTTTGTVADGGVLAAETIARITGQTDNANAAATAQATASTAASTASAASAAAAAARATASSAQSNASAAQTSASAAVSTANGASSAASQALTTAAGAVPSASPIITAPLSNPAVIAASYTIPTNSNAVSVGPITVAIGATMTVPHGSTYRIL
jgi:hypothetical protein